MRTFVTVAAAVLMLTAARGAQAQVTLNSVRVGAADTVKLAQFYEKAFGMQETNRIGAPTGPEVFVNFGATVDAAKGAKTPPVVLMHRDADDSKDPIPHIIFNVTNINATVAAIKAAGGSMASDPKPFGNTGLVIGIAMDPAGNRIELIQPRPSPQQ